MALAGKVHVDRRNEQGAWLFLISLSIFFLACMFLYAIYIVLRIAPESGDVQAFYVPRNFVLTTVNLIAISTLLHLAVNAVRREKLVDLARYIILSFVLSLVFFAIQGSGLAWMINEMQKPGPALQNLYGFTFFLVIVHALHVVGGVAGMVFLLFGIRRHAYDHERYFPVRFCALYWHFLDIVWIVMLASFVLAAYVSKLPVG
jgi:cytochrome c oxidase subunit 3